MSSLYFKFRTILIKYMPVALPKIVNLKKSNGLNMMFDESSVTSLNFYRRRHPNADWLKNVALIKNCQFFSNFDEPWPK